MASLVVCIGEDFSRFVDTVIGWVVVGGLVFIFNVIVISWSVAVINVVCDVDLTAGVIVDIDGIINVAVVTCLGFVEFVGSVFDELAIWVVFLAWVVELVEVFVN